MEAITRPQQRRPGTGKVLVHGAKGNDHDYSYPLRQSHEGAFLNLWCGWLVHRLTFLLGRYAQLRGLVFEAAVASCVRLRFIPGVRISQYGNEQGYSRKVTFQWSSVRDSFKLARRVFDIVPAKSWVTNLT